MFSGIAGFTSSAGAHVTCSTGTGSCVTCSTDTDSRMTCSKLFINCMQLQGFSVDSHTFT